jgi:hypothetical protein
MRVICLAIRHRTGVFGSNEELEEALSLANRSGNTDAVKVLWTEFKRRRGR